MISLLDEITRWKQITPYPISILEKEEVPHFAITKRDKKSAHLICDAQSYALTPREGQVVALLMQGVSTYKKMASSLNISARTVEFYLKSLRDKLVVKNKAELRRKLNKSQLIMDEE